MSFPWSYSVLGLVPGLILTVAVALIVLYTSLTIWYVHSTTDRPILIEKGDFAYDIPNYVTSVTLVKSCSGTLSGLGMRRRSCFY